jgi:rSAM-associated Gly-rich repeat protein
MKKSSSLLAAALQLLACAGFLPNTTSAKVDSTDPSQATISERVARVRNAIVEQAQTPSDQTGIQLTGWGNWHNGWRNWGNGWRKGGWGKGAWGKGGWGNGGRRWGNG